MVTASGGMTLPSLHEKKKGCIMKRYCMYAGILAVLLLLVILTTCRRDQTPAVPPDSDLTETSEVAEPTPSEPSDTAAEAVTETAAEIITDGQTDSATEGRTEADPPDTGEAPSHTEAVTESPSPLSAAEAGALLSAALGREAEPSGVTVRVSRDGAVYASRTVIRGGEDFYVERLADGCTEKLTAVGDRAYYLLTRPADFPPVEKRFVMALTPGEREALYGRYAEEGAIGILGSEGLAEALLGGELKGVRYGDGRVELTCEGVDGDAAEALLGMDVAGAEVTFALSLDREIRVTLLRCTVSLSDGSGGGAAVTHETAVSYDSVTVAIPAHPADYAPTTYGELFGIRPPEADPEAAAAAGLPLGQAHYTLIGENAGHGVAEQYAFLRAYPHCYEGRSFTLFGTVTRGPSGEIALSLGEGMTVALRMDSAAVPVEGAYVRITATLGMGDDGGDPADLSDYAMKVTSCEVLAEARGPNGGRLLYVTSAALNVRSSSDTSTPENIIGSYAKGDLVEVFEQDGDGWYRVNWNGRDGYVSGRYLSETRP